MMAEATEQQLRDYVIGALPDAEQSALEEVLLKDRAKFEEAWALENDLVDRYVCNQMPAHERAQFERHYLVSQRHRERVATAEALLHEIDETPAPLAETVSWWERWRAAWRWPQLVFSGALAAALLLSLGGALWFWRERAQLNEQLAQARRQSQAEAERYSAQQQQLTGELAQEQRRNAELQAELQKLQQQPVAAPAPALLSFLLAPATRAGSGSPTVIPRQRRHVQLLMELSGARFASYQATLQTVEGRVLFSLPVRVTPDRAFAALALPASGIGRGDYVVILSGRSANDLEEIDRYFFRVQ